MQNKSVGSTIVISLSSLLVLTACGSSSSDIITDAVEDIAEDTIEETIDETVADTLLDCGTDQPSALSEGEIGDLSDDIDSPTPWVLGPGVNILTAGTVSTDNDYATFTVGPCDMLTGILLDDYNSFGDETAFIALQEGNTFTVEAETAETDGASILGELLGYSHYGTSTIGQDILQPISEGFGAIGFTPPLDPGDYTMWLNQTGGASDFTLVLEVSRVMEP